MKFSQIKKLPPIYYTTDVSLKDIRYTIDHYQETQEKFGYKFELNPDFQRGYVWNTAQKSKYIEWLLMGGNSGKDIYFNHPGWQDDFIGDMVCLDGLQRLSACLEFVDGKVLAYGHYLPEYTDRFPSSITLRFNVLRLPTRKDILNWYLVFNSGGTIHSDIELNRVRQLLENEK